MRQLLTLGRIALRADDDEPDSPILAQPKRLVLLAYLCVESRRRPVGRSQLVTLFWPDSNDERGHASLRQALHFLRATAGARAIMRSGDHSLSIDPAALRCDAVELLEHESRTPEAAIDLFHGDFLSGVLLADVSEELEHWLLRTRLQLRETALAAAKALQSAAVKAGETTASFYWLRRILTLAPEDEQAARTLIELHWRAGNRTEALRVFETLKRTLSDDFDVAPEQRTLELVRRIREGQDPGPAMPPLGRVEADATRLRSPSATPPRAPQSRTTSIAILPFIEQTRVDPAGYLGNGLADELHRMLSQFTGLRVASHAVAMMAGPDARGSELLRSTLDVDWVIDGSLKVDSDRLRIEARLIELTTGDVARTMPFDVASSDLFGACSRIVPEVFAVTGIHPSVDERALLRRHASANPAAFDAFLKGRYHWRKRPRDSARALEWLQQAVSRDPSFALAHAALADVYNTLGSWEAAASPPMEAFPKAQDAALAALCIDAHCAEAHTSLGYAAMHFLWQWDAAGRQFRRALALNPNYAHAHHWYSHQLMARGEVAASLESSLRALALDPLDLIINAHLAWHYWLAGQHERALEQSQRASRLDASDHWFHFFSGLALSGLDESARAIDEQRTAVTLSNNSPVMAAALGYAYGAAGDRKLARRTLDALRKLAGGVSIAYEQAVVETALGDTDAALVHLNDAYRDRSAWLAYVAVDPRLKPLAAEPRFRALLVAVGLDDVRPAWASFDSS